MTTIVVTAADLANTSAEGQTKWFMYNDDTDAIDNTLGSFVIGPATPPHGRGSVEFIVGTSQQQFDRKNIATYQFTGTLLTSITAMSFSAYSHGGSGGAGPNESPFLNFNVDLDGSNTFQGRLVYVPSANGAVPQDTWNTFDVINGGNALWTWSHFASNRNTWPDNNTSQYRTWSAIKSAFPQASILASDGWLGIRVGEPGPTGYTGDVDSFTWGTTTGTTTLFDFEPPMTVTAQDIAAFAGAAHPFNGQVATGTYSGEVTLSAMINWGDGNTTSGTVTSSGTNFAVFGNHIYTAAGNFPLTVTVSDTEGHTASSSSTAVVSEAPLAINVDSIQAEATIPFSGPVAIITGANSASDTTATINWGDGTLPSTGTITANQDGTLTVSGIHTYATTTGSPFTLTVSATEGTQTAQGTGTATVQAPLVVHVNTIQAVANMLFGPTPIATITGATSSSDTTATIDWGDGTTSPGTVAGTTTLTVSGSHTYTQTGTFTVTVTAIEGLRAVQASGQALVHGAQIITIDDSVQGSGLNQFNYSGSGWQHCTGGCGGDTSGLYNGSTSWDTTPNEFVTVSFTGTQIRFYGVVDPRNGIGAVSIDSGAETMIDFYAPTRAGNQLLWTSPVLPSGSHTFKLRVTGTKNPRSSSTFVAPDRVDITTTIPGTITIDDSVQGSGLNQFNYSGSGWQHCTGGCSGDTSHLYNGSASWDTTSNDFVTVSFIGTQIRFYGVVDPRNGIGAVSIDSGAESTIDFYAPTRAGDQLLWTSPVLPSSSHSFKLRVTGTKNPQSSNTFVIPDRVDILS